MKIRMLCALAALLTISAWASPQVLVDPEVDAIVSQYVNDGSFSGVVLVQRGNRILHHQAYGLASRELQVPNRIDTVFRLGSVSKQFAAALVMKLKEEGRIQLSDSIGKFLEVPDSWNGISVEELLTHQSGLNEILGLNFNALRARLSSAELLAGAIRTKKGPEGRFEYSNANYILLALIVEKIVGKPYRQHFNETFKGLGFGEIRSDFDWELVPRMASGYFREFDTFKKASGETISNIVGAGDVRATAGDISKWIDILRDEKFLGKDSKAEMWSAHSAMDERASYGYGWIVLPVGSRKLVTHSGLIFGYQADLRYWPDEDVRIIVLSNLWDAKSGDADNDTENIPNKIGWDIDLHVFPEFFK